MTERLHYDVLRRDGVFELRRYGAHLTAEVRVRASGPAAATNIGFSALAGYIFGGNHEAGRIEMTTPVTAERAGGHRIEMTVPVTAERVGGLRIEMTAPVTAEPAASGGDEFVVSFTMPRRFASIVDLPEPDDPRVRLAEVPAHRAAAIGFGGYLTDAAYRHRLRELEEWMAANGLMPAGTPIAAQFDGPWKPAFARHNEIIVPVMAEGADAPRSREEGE